MAQEPKYYIVEASALPDVFRKVAEAKRLLETGEASTVGEATPRFINIGTRSSPFRI